MEFINNGFNGDAGTNEHHEINGKVEHKLDINTRVEKYHVPEDQWNQKMKERLEDTSVNGNLEKTSLSQYKVSGEQWDKFDKQLKFNGIDPGLPHVPKTQEITKDFNKKLSLSRQSSEEQEYAKLDTMNDRRRSVDILEYEKVKKMPHRQHKDR